MVSQTSNNIRTQNGAKQSQIYQRTGGTNTSSATGTLQSRRTTTAASCDIEKSKSRSLSRIVTMIKPWLASRPLKVRTIHEILCEIIEKEGEYKYTVINNRKLLLSNFTFEEIFIAAQLYETFMQEDLQQIVDNFQLNQAFTRGKSENSSVMTNEETKNGQIRFAQVLRQKVPDFFTLPCYTLQKNLFNLAFFTMIYADTFCRGLKEGSLYRKFAEGFSADERNLKNDITESYFDSQSTPSGLRMLLVFLADSRHLPDDAKGYYFRCSEEQAKHSPQLVFVNSVYSVFLKHWSKIKLGMAKMRVYRETPKLDHFLRAPLRHMEREIVGQKTETFCYSPFHFHFEDPNKNIHAFLASRNWTNAESYTAPEQSRKKRGDPETPKIYSMRSACSIFFDVPLGLNPQLDDFHGKPIVKMNLLLGLVCSTICEVLLEMKGGPKQVLVADSGHNGFLAVLLASVARLKLISEVSIVGLNCSDTKGADRLAKEWGADNVKFRRHSLFRQSGKSSGKLAEARLIVLNATSSESGIANPGAHFLDEDFTDGNAVYRCLYTAQMHGIYPTENAAKLHKTAIMHSLTFFPKTDTIVYFTQSMLRAENEEVVRSAIEEFDQKYNNNKDFKLEVKSYADKLPSMTFEGTGVEGEGQGHQQFMRLKSQQETNGGVIAVITRGKITKSASEILAQALKTGLLTKKDLGQSDNSEDSESMTGKDITSQDAKSAGSAKKNKKKNYKSLGGRHGRGGKAKSKPDKSKQGKMTLEEQIAALQAGKSLKSLQPPSSAGQPSGTGSNSGSRMITMMSNSGIEYNYQIVPDNASSTGSNGGGVLTLSTVSTAEKDNQSNLKGEMADNQFKGEPTEKALMRATESSQNIQIVSPGEEPRRVPTESSGRKQRTPRKPKSAKRTRTSVTSRTYPPLMAKFDSSKKQTAARDVSAKNIEASVQKRLLARKSSQQPLVSIKSPTLDRVVKEVGSARERTAGGSLFGQPTDLKVAKNLQKKKNLLVAQRQTAFTPYTSQNAAIANWTSNSSNNYNSYHQPTVKEIDPPKVPARPAPSAKRRQTYPIIRDKTPCNSDVIANESTISNSFRVTKLSNDIGKALGNKSGNDDTKMKSNAQDDSDVYNSVGPQDRRKSTPNLQFKELGVLTPRFQNFEEGDNSFHLNVEDLLRYDSTDQDGDVSGRCLDFEDPKGTPGKLQTTPVVEEVIGSENSSNKPTGSKESQKSDGAMSYTIRAQSCAKSHSHGSCSPPKYEPHIEGSSRAPFMMTPKGFGKTKSYVPPKNLDLNGQLHSFEPKNTPRTLEKIMQMANQQAKLISNSSHNINSFDSLNEGSFKFKPPPTRLKSGENLVSHTQTTPLSSSSGKTSSTISSANINDKWAVEARKTQQAIKEYIHSPRKSTSSNKKPRSKSKVNADDCRNESAKPNPLLGERGVVRSKTSNKTAGGAAGEKSADCGSQMTYSPLPPQTPVAGQKLADYPVLSG